MKQPKWTQQQLNAASALAKEIMQAAPADLTIEQYMKDTLATRVEGIDAGQQVSELCAGIDLFHKTLARAEQKGLAELVGAELDRLAADGSEQEQADRLHAILCACAHTTGQPEPESAGPDQIPALRSAICEYFNDYALLCTSNAALVELAQAIGTDRLQPLQQAEAQALDERYIALALYIQKATGALDGIPAELSAQEIGVSVASSLCTQQVLRDGARGAIDFSTMKAKLKLIAGVALLALLIIVSAKLALAVGALTFLFVQMVVGLGVIGTIVAGVLGLALGKQVVDSGVELAEIVAAATGVDVVMANLYDKWNEWYQNTLRPAAQAFWQRVRALLHRTDSETVPETKTAPAEQTAAEPATAKA